MQCPDCGTPIDDNIEYCSICSRRITKTDKELYYAKLKKAKELKQLKENQKRLETEMKRKQELSKRTTEQNNQHISEQTNKCIPKCPTCGSTNLERIGTINRVVSFGLFGFGSGKIGKQFKCRNCKYMW